MNLEKSAARTFRFNFKLICQFFILFTLTFSEKAEVQNPTLDSNHSESALSASQHNSTVAAQHLSALGGHFGAKDPQSGDRILGGYVNELATSAAGRQAENWLNLLGGSSRVTLGSVMGSAENEIAADVLLPIFDNQHHFLAFSQVGFRRYDKRTVLNLGLGGRYFTPGWMTGGNVFFDNDITGQNRRWGIGLEWWRDNLRVSANSYMRLSDWQQSRVYDDYDERPANGLDLEVSGWLPTYPALGAKLKYEKYFGENVALFSRDKLARNPQAWGLSLNWTPVPLITFELGHRVGGETRDSSVGFMVN